MSFFQETCFFTKKKAPAARLRPRKIVFFLEKRYFGRKKGACGTPEAEGTCFFHKKKSACGTPEAEGTCFEKSHWVSAIWS